MDRIDIEALAILTSEIYSERRPYYVYEWMVKRYSEEVKQTARNLFNGEYIIIPKKMEPKK